MKKILSVALAVFLISSLSAQIIDSTAKTSTAPSKPPKKDWSKVVIDPAGDHFLMAFTYDNWMNAPDSISKRESGFSRGFNVAIMLNSPFKSDPRWSVAFGLGISNSNIFFKNTNIDVKATSKTLPFTPTDSTDHFKKYKLATTFAEVPIELRYTANPVEQKKSWKVALGVKVGTMLNTHTKGKTLENKNNVTINSYTEKEAKKTYFNTLRLATTARVGIGNFSLFWSYAITALIKDVAGPGVHPYQVGLAISGL